jgi:hypothetical protein
MFKLMPIAEGIGVGALDAVLRKNDVDNGRTEWTKQYGLWAEVGLFAGALLADQTRMLRSDFTDPLAIASGTLLAQRLTTKALEQSATTTAYAAPRMAIPVGNISSFGAVNKQPTMGIV